jgi:peptidoglycan/xylan/chitin deacetylase (PgdA/CDA1 family)
MQSSIPEIPVVYFHSVAPAKNPKWARNYLTLELKDFEEFLRFLRRNRYETIFFDEYYLIKLRGEKLKKKICVLTFDDGYVDNYIYVWPFLKKYGFKGTVFISPESVDHKRTYALTMEDVWEGNSKMPDIEQWGFLSWDEMKTMQDSGIVDIQSHTMTHTKNFVSDKLTGIHHPGGDCLYPVGNLFNDRQPYYINDPGFENLIPYGYPFFEEQSSVIARKVEINPDFILTCLKMLKGYDFRNYNFDEAFNIIKPIYNNYQQNGKLITGKENHAEYKQRLNYEIVESKRIIENKLNKVVSFLCWPHGDNNELCHEIALENGYLMTTTGKAKDIRSDDLTRIGERMGVGFNSFTNRAKTIMKIKAFSGKFPYRQVLNLSRKLISNSKKILND